MKIKLYVREDIGTGSPIVLLHGIFGDGTQWRTISKLLKKHHRVIVVDVLGHGKSPRPKNAKYTPKEHATALRNVLVEIGATKDLTVVGYSMGGAVALSYCAMYPDDIKQLYLLSTPFYLKPEQMIAIDYTNSLMFTKISIALYKLGDSILHNKKSSEKIVAFANDSERFNKMIGAYDNKLESGIIKDNLKNMIWDFDFAGNLAKVTAPTTIYAGKKDLFIVQGQLYALKQFKPYADIERLSLMKVDHMLVQNLPRGITALVTKNNNQLLHVGFDKGSGPVLVLLHGIESSSSYWSHVAPALAEHHRVICLDLLGFGKSPKPLNIAYSLDDQVDAISKTLNQMGVSKFALAGHSLGSIVALAFVARYPNKVQSLVMFSPVILTESLHTNNQLLKRINIVDKFSDTSFMLSQTAHAIGDKRIKKYLPFVRSVNNSIKDQASHILARKAAKTPTKMIYGQNDPLIDNKLLKELSLEFDNCRITKVPNSFHNFPMHQPSIVLKAIDGDVQYTKKPIPVNKIPATFMRQIVKMSAPILVAKSTLYIATGVLLFTQFAPYVLVAGLIAYVMYKAVGIIKGAFTLKNEGLTYLGYIILGIGMGVVGYFLIQYPEFSLRVTALIISGLVILTGIIRLTVGLLWTKSAKLKTPLLLTGGLFSVAGLGALFGNLVSVYIIVYSIAAYLIFRGIQFGTYAYGAILMAFIRGYNK